MSDSDSITARFSRRTPYSDLHLGQALANGKMSRRNGGKVPQVLRADSDLMLDVASSAKPFASELPPQMERTRGTFLLRRRAFGSGHCMQSARHLRRAVPTAAVCLPIRALPVSMAQPLSPIAGIPIRG